MKINIWLPVLFLFIGLLKISSQSCFEAIELKGDTLIQDTFGYVSALSIDCYGQNNLISGKWYKISGDDEIYEILPLSETVYILEGDCDSYACINSNSNKYFLTKGKNYYIVQGHPSYELQIKAHRTAIKKIQKLPSQFCATSEILTCGNTLSIPVNSIFSDATNLCQSYQSPTIWFKIKGNGEKLNLKIDGADYSSIVVVESDDCKNFNCSSFTNFGNEFSFIGGISNSFIVSIQPGQFTKEVLNITLTCAEVTENISCELVQDLRCNDLKYIPLTNDEDGNYLASGQFAKGKWYHLVQKDTSYHLKFELPFNESGNNTLKIFEGTSENLCQGLELTSQYPLSTGIDFVIETQSEKNTFLVFDITNNQELDASCNEKNKGCNGAKEITEGLDIIITKNLNLEPYIGTDNNSYNFDHWFKITNDFLHLEMEVLHETPFPSSSMDFAILEGNCEEFKIIKRFEYTEIANKQLLFEDLPISSGKTYYIAAGMKDMLNQVKLKFSYKSKNIPGSSCKNAIELTPNKRAWSSNPESTFISDFYAGKSLYIEPRIWSKVTGDGSVYNIHFDQNSFKEIKVLKGNCNAEFELLYTGQGNYFLEHLSFETKAGEEYFILFVPRFSTGVDKYLLPFITTSNAAQNSTCVGAKSISCEIAIEQINEGAFSSNDSLCNVKNNTFWYKIESNNTNIDWLKSIEQTNLHVKAYKGSCDNLECIPLQLNQSSINIDSNSTYYLTLSPDVPLNSVFSFGLECSQPLAGGNDCNRALEITCNKNYLIDFRQGIFSHKSDYTEFNAFWIKVKGDNKLKNFSLRNFFIFSYYIYDDCDNLILSKENLLSESDILRNNFSILIPDGKEYKIKLIGLDYFKGTLELSCVDPVENYECDRAIPLACGDNFDYSLSANQPTIAPHSFQSWYNLPSHYGIIKLTSIYPKFGAEYQIFKGKTCAEKVQVHRNSLYNEVYGLLDDTIANYYLVLFSGGNYFDDTLNLKLDCYDFDKNDACLKAKEISCGKTYTFTAVPPTNTSSNYPCSDEKPGGWMKLVGDGKTYKLELSYPESEFSEMEIIISEGVCDSFVCIDQFNLSSFKRYAYFETKPGKNYFIKSTILYGYGPYNFKIDCFDPTRNHKAANAKSLQCNEEILGLVNIFERDTTFDDFLEFRSGLFYRLPDLGKIVKFEFPNLNENYHLVFYKISNDNLKYDFRISVNSEINYFEVLSQGEEYIFKVITDNGQVPVYFKTHCYNIPVNQSCDKAKELICMEEISAQVHNPLNYNGSAPCGSIQNSLSYWYKLPISEVSKINVKSENFAGQLAQGSCGNLTCLKSTVDSLTPFSVSNLDSSQIYLILHSTSYNDTAIYSASITCTENLVNIHCDSSKYYSCGDTILLDMSRGYQQDLTGPDRCLPYDRNGLFYKFKGDGRVWNFLNDTTTQEHYSIVILENDNCNLLNCVAFSTFYPQIENLPFIAKKDSSYTLFVSYNGHNPPKVKLITECLDTINPSICETAKFLRTDDTTFVVKNSSAYKVYDGKSVFDISGEWFSILGTDKTYKITNVDGGITHFRLYEDDCSLNNCIASGIVEKWQDYKFMASHGHNYYLHLSNTSKNIDTPKLRITNYFIPSNDLCEGAQSISCGQNFKVKANTYSPDVFYTCSGINSGWFKFKSEETTMMKVNFGSNNVESISIHESCNKACFSHLNSPDDLKKGYLAFEFQEGVEYLLSINWSTEVDFKDFIINFECLPILENVKPTRAINLGCDLLHINSTTKINIYTESCKHCFNESSLWYKFVGTGQQISVLFNQISVGLEMFDKDLNSLGNLKWSNNEFITIKGDVYYLKVDFPKAFKFEDFILGIDNLCSTQIQETELQIITIYPNPTSTLVYFDLPENTDALNVQIFSITGQLISAFTKKTYNKAEQLDVSQYKSGLYLVKIEKGKTQMIGKFLKI